MLDEKFLKRIISFGGIIPIKAFKDNYIWSIIKNGKIAVIDPGDYKVVLEFIEKYSLKLIAILITHHHKDHTAGVEILSKKFNIPVFASKKSKLPFCNNHLIENDIIKLRELDLKLKIIDVPGHTDDHIAFYGKTIKNRKVLFCGDVLFSAGCGRVLENNYIQMFNSLKKLCKLPLNTIIFCAHEYTISNLIWAMNVDKDNKYLQFCYKHAKLLRKYGYPTLPSSIIKELYINPFLRTDYINIIKSASLHAKIQLQSQIDVFIELRKWKNAS
ncbi:MAG: hydroxyacylglutathione hydrolase [Candidatus Kinetoplastibacterium crithidii]|nr:MAG: hydroxyacylglutathione hydrolase [Candidatus Kinetoplastibacterium crithidii]